MKNEQKECKAVRLLERVGSYIKEYVSAHGIADRVDVDTDRCIELAKELFVKMVTVPYIGN